MPPPGEHNDVNEKPKAPTPGSKLDQNTAELFRAELRTPGHEKSPSLEKSPAEKTPRGENGLPKPPKSDAAVKSDDPKSLIFDNKIFAGGSGTLTTEKLAGLAADRFKAPAGDTLTVPPIARPETLNSSKRPSKKCSTRM